MSIPGFTYIGMYQYTSGDVTRTVEEYRHDDTGMEFVLLPKGRVRRSVSIGVFHEEYGKPVERFLMAKYECTQAQWKSVMGRNPSNLTGDTLPVHFLSTGYALHFCRKAGLSLPTRAEWHYAEQYGNTTYFVSDYLVDRSEPGAFPKMVNALKKHAWIWSNSNDVPHPVGRKLPNACGLYDMLGNVSELCTPERSEYFALGGNWVLDGTWYEYGLEWSPEGDHTSGVFGFRCAAPVK